MLAWRSFERRATGLTSIAVALGAGVEGIVAGHNFEPVLTITGAGAGLALGLRKRFPLIGPLLAVGGFDIGALWGDHVFWRSNVLLVVALLAAWRIGRDNPLPRASAGAVIAALQVGAIRILAPASAGLNPVAMAVEVSGCWVAGAVVGQKTQKAAKLSAQAREIGGGRDAAAQEAVRAERSKMARELHDVVSHTLTVMTLQAGGARMLLDTDPDRALAAVGAIEQAGHEALAGLRRMVSVLDGDDHLGLEPQAGMARLERLLEEMRAAGLEVDDHVDGTLPSDGSGIDVAAYRVVQDALTNGLRHGRGAATLRIARTSDELVIEVVNEIGEPFAHGSGAGLIGLGERVGLFGGYLDFGAHSDGRFHFHATLPAETP